MFGTHLPQERKSVGTKCSFIFPFVPPLIQLFFPLWFWQSAADWENPMRSEMLIDFCLLPSELNFRKLLDCVLFSHFFPYCIWHSLCNRIHQQKLSFEKKKWKLKNKTANKFSRDESFLSIFHSDNKRVSMCLNASLSKE